MPTTVERCALAPGLTISRVLTGLWQVADMERGGVALDPAAASEAMRPYVAAGFTTFDMADHYGSAEVIAGTFEPRQQVQLLTKWVPKPGPVTRDDVRAAVVRALTRLRRERLDLLQLHAWRYSDPAWLDALWYVQELKAEGLVGQIGVTNFDTAHLRVAVKSGIEIVSNQVSFSLIDQRAAGRMSEFCLAHGIKLLAYGTLAGGLLHEKWLGVPDPDASDASTWSMMKYKRFIDAAGGWGAFQHLLCAADGVARRLGKGVSIANVASRYILEQPAVGGVIIGARLGERSHAGENARLFAFSLDEAAHEELRQAMGQLHPIRGDCGDEYRRPPFLTASGDLSHHIESFPAPYATTVGSDGRTRATSGTSWETLAGYARAVRVGDRIMVSGTTATHGSLVVGGNDAAAQAHFAIDKIEGAIESLGGTLAAVVRTRVFVANVVDWEAVARVHGERFADIRPANTLVQARLIGDEYLVEIEAEAVVRSGSAQFPTA